MIIVFLVAFLFAVNAEAAIIYIDASMAGDCTSGNYSIANRNCTGSDGNGYNDIAAARNASANGDTLYLRAGTHTANTGGEGIIPKTNQVWRTYPGDMPTRAQVNSSLKRVFTWFQVNGIQIRDLVLVGGTDECIWAGDYQGLTLDNNECRGWNTSALDYHHGFKFGFGGRNAVVTRNWIHSPAAAGPANEYAGLSWGDFDSGHVVEYNFVEGTGMGIWIDVAGGSVNDGLTPHIVRYNRVRNIARYCYHVEVGSVGTFRYNTADGCGQVAFFARAGNGTNPQLKIQNNTFYNYSISGIHLQQDGANGKYTFSNIENNILVSNSGYPLVVGALTADDTTNVFRNNLVHTVNNSQGVCWRKGTGSGFACDSATTFADSAAGMSSWNSTYTNVDGNIAGDPLFINAGSQEFGLQASSPAINAGRNLGAAFNGSAPDIGAFETFLCNTATVAGNTVTITCSMNLNVPVLPASGISGFSVNNGRSVTAAARQSGTDTMIEVTFDGAACTVGQSWTYSYTPGNVTDSFGTGGPGGPKYQRLNAITDQAITNECEGGAGGFAFTQSYYRFHGLRGTESSPLVKAAINTPWTIQPGGCVRLRLKLACTGADCPQIGAVLRYDKDGGGYTLLPDAYSTDNIKFLGTEIETDVPTNGTNTTEQLTSDHETDLTGLFVRTASAIPTFDLSQNSEIELEYPFCIDSDQTPGPVFSLRLYNQDGSAFTYGATPTLTVVNAAAQGLGGF